MVENTNYKSPFLYHLILTNLGVVHRYIRAFKIRKDKMGVTPLINKRNT